MTDGRRSLPSVSALLETDSVRKLLERAPRTVVVEAIRRTIDMARAAPASTPADDSQWANAVTAEVDRASQPSLRRVLNGTGVVLHTNLGRAPLARAAVDAISRIAQGFTNLEYDVERGERGSRYVHCAALLRELTGAEDALVVNNCAAALVLVLNTLANQRAAIVSRGELVEIGGSFRIPEIMERSGVRLVEVGTTNRTNVDDYRRAIDADTGIIVKVHRSNFALSGFVAEATAAELGALASERGVPLLHDLGSGLLLALDAYGLSGEPTARDAIAAAGASAVITMSGDKLLGGPQAGIILGRRVLLDSIRKNPLTRSYRVDKLTLAALEATLALYREPAKALREIPALAQLTCPVTELRGRAAEIRASLRKTEGILTALSVVDSEASVGGGAFPTARIPSVALAISGDAAQLERRLRGGTLPVIARVADGRLLIDLRTIAPHEDTTLIAALDRAMQ
jgi:L-seryl-tRNA(Ser) seleniumtransferase